jgi:hypothetical protein
MELDIDIKPNGQYLLVRYTGPNSPEISRQANQKILDACDEFECFNILVIAYLENSLKVLENYNLYEMFKEFGFSSRHKMACVEQNPHTHQSTLFAETVLVNRGMNVRLFREREEAEKWLLSQPSYA